ncbi:hypothetical protein [Anabaena azotica]|uniref:Secreted protein n=1 Tax=Anabaena azotica FACHB-119 TaxID=947527 RepID=A0ABR8DEM5_9NOST|nr:hypothetical protein [Anabaena azotica]MBD2504652.1 hypothetical protein [Anabaena azotica FACHB-119]
MGLLDAFLLTLINVIACLALPKLLAWTLSLAKSKHTKTVAEGATSPNSGTGITSFPYCTTYSLTGSQFCKFSPHFCAKCSAN